ncbi:hypothetical protein IFR04_005581 [Cadophora malorum]|uniref:Uncharacterized protein n=1 Tax=Cadophora malorum TaxID=108018 RepID=A0A8H7TGQ2_9HELO|nr:hypothetical protein IFR04_005581 [Cadophora malorum]
MASSETYSTTAVDGSGDGSYYISSPQSSSTPVDTSTQGASRAALSSQRITTFLADTSLSPPIAPSTPGYIDRRNNVAYSCHAASVTIASFDDAFNRSHDSKGKDEKGNNNNKKKDDEVKNNSEGEK